MCRTASNDSLDRVGTKEPDAVAHPGMNDDCRSRTCSVAWEKCRASRPHHERIHKAEVVILSQVGNGHRQRIHREYSYRVQRLMLVCDSIWTTFRMKRALLATRSPSKTGNLRFFRGNTDQSIENATLKRNAIDILRVFNKMIDFRPIEIFSILPFIMLEIGGRWWENSFATDCRIGDWTDEGRPNPIGAVRVPSFEP